jgi:hypothetical protein
LKPLKQIDIELTQIHRDSPEVVAVKAEEIAQERAETQNGVLILYWQMRKIDSLFEASQKEFEEDEQAIMGDDANKDDNLPPVARITIGALTAGSAPSITLTMYPVFSLWEN